MALTAALIANPHQRHQVAAMTALAAGLARHGINVERVNNPYLRAPGDCPGDFVVTWGDRSEIRDRPRLCLEAGYINGTSGDYVGDRLRFISTSWNGLHGRGDDIAARPPDRWRALGIELDDWKTDGEYILVLEQFPTDSTAPRRDDWQAVKSSLLSRYRAPIRVRRHPLVERHLPPIADDLAPAVMAVTWASTAAVEAVIAGVPTVVLDRGSMAWPVAAHSLYDELFVGDRRQWAYNLAYRQWSLDELASGAAWVHIGDATR